MGWHIWGTIQKVVAFRLFSLLLFWYLWAQFNVVLVLTVCIMNKFAVLRIVGDFT